MVLRFIQLAMKWQPIPASAWLPSGTLVEVLWGQPEQKNGVLMILRGRRSVRSSSLDSRKASRFCRAGLS